MITLQRKHAFSALAVISVFHALPTQADDSSVQFDTGILKKRGLDSGLGQYFATSARYTPGVHSVNVQVNGRDIGQRSPRFGRNGQLCVTESFLQGAGLIVPREVARLARQEEQSRDEKNATGQVAQCYDYRKDYPTAVIIPEPGQGGLSLTVPPEAMDTTSPGVVAQNYRTGGSAGLLNYQIFSTKTEFDDDSNTYDQAMLEEGFNVHDWLVRSRQSLTWENSKFSNDNLYTYAQHTIVPLKKQLQVGQINSAGSLLSGVSMTGVQLTPEDALGQDGGSGVQVIGIAHTPQARVDVRQLGRVVYSTLVPAGPFTLTDVPVTSLNNDLDVTVSETDGSQSHFVIPAATINGRRLTSPQGIAVAMGRYRDEDGGTEEPWLATLSDGWHLYPWMNAGAGIMVAQQYDAFAGSVDTLPLKNLTLSATLRVSDDQRGDNHGQSGVLSAGYTFGQNLGMNASATLYSSGYRDLPDTLTDDFTQYSGQYATSVHWNNPLLGAFSVGYTLSQGAEGNNNSRYVNASWGRTFGKANISVTWQTQVDSRNSRDSCDDNNDSRHCSLNNNDGNMFYVNVSIPLGDNRNVSFYSRTHAHDTTSGAQTGGSLTDNSSYSMSAEQDSENRENDFSGSLNSNLHYTQLGLNASTQGSDSKTYSASLNGGMVVHSGGITFSPWAIKDTFGIVDAGREVSGAEISTPSGPVWTDHWGQAVIPSIPEYRNTRLEMNTTSLPESVDIDNGFAQLAAGHGSVSNVNFHVLNVRRVMMHVRMVDGSILKKGSSVVDQQGSYIATVVDDGLVFLGDATGIQALYLVNDKGRHQCQIHYSLQEEINKAVAYEQIKGVCQ